MQGASLTAFYCAGTRMEDAERPKPVCGDRLAGLLMDDEGRRIYDRFREQTNPNAFNVTRHRIVDDLLRARLRDDPARPILVIGAGFDSRAFRLTGGRWFEVDEATLIAYKNERLPRTGCPNPLERVAVDFTLDWLPELLERFRQASRVSVVLEGVLMYLEEAEIARLLATLQRRVPHHEIICDLMTRRFFERYSQPLHHLLAQLGTRFRFTSDRPEGIFLEAGYRRVERISIAGRARALKAFRLPPLVLPLLPTLRRGYSVQVFEPA